MKEGWTYKKLGEVCEKIKTIRWEEINEEDSFSYIDLSSVDRLSLSIKDPQTITKTNAPSRAKQIVKKGDILFATTRPTLRRVCLIPSSFDNQICSTGFCVIRPKENILSKWIYYLLQSDNFYYYIEPLQTGASYPAVTDNVVKGYQISSPSLDEQRAIVARLDSAFAQIDSLKANAEKQLSEARQLFQKALEEAMTPKEGWEEKTIGEIADVKGGKRVPKGYKLESSDTGYKYIRVSDFTDDGTIDLTNIQYISKEVYEQIKRYTITDEDLYISIAGTIGKSGIIPPDLNGANLTENACKLVFKTNINKRFVYFFTKSDIFMSQVSKATKQASQPKLALTRLAEIVISIPPLSTQHTIVSHLDALSSNVRALEAKLQKMKDECDALKQAMLREVFE